MSLLQDPKSVMLRVTEYSQTMRPGGEPGPRAVISRSEGFVRLIAKNGGQPQMKQRRKEQLAEKLAQHKAETLAMPKKKAKCTKPGKAAGKRAAATPKTKPKLEGGSGGGGVKKIHGKGQESQGQLKVKLMVRAELQDYPGGTLRYAEAEPVAISASEQQASYADGTAYTPEDSEKMVAVITPYGGGGHGGTQPQLQYGQYYNGAAAKIPFYPHPHPHQQHHQPQHQHQQSTPTYPNEPDFMRSPLRSPLRKDVFGWLSSEALSAEYAVDADPFS